MYDASLATVAFVFQNLHHFVLSLPNPEPFSRFTPLEIDNLPCNANSLQVFSSKSQKLDNLKISIQRLIHKNPGHPSTLECTAMVRFFMDQTLLSQRLDISTYLYIF